MGQGLYRGCVIVSQLMVLNLLSVATWWPLVTVPLGVLALFSAFRTLTGPADEATFGQLVGAYFTGLRNDVRSALVLTGLGLLVCMNCYGLWRTQREVLWSPGFLVPALFLLDWFLTTAVVAAHYRLPAWGLLRAGFFTALSTLHRGVPALVLAVALSALTWHAPFALVTLGLSLPLFVFFSAVHGPVAKLEELLIDQEERRGA